MRRRVLGLAAVMLATAAGPAAAAPVAVRVEGDDATIVPRTAVTTNAVPVVKDATHPCNGTSAAGALEQASAGNWAGVWNDAFATYSVDAVGGERHVFGSGEFWSLFVNDVPASSGLCGIELQAGDQLLLAPEPETGAQRNPLVLQGVPATAAPGQAVTVRVARVVTTFDASFTPVTTVEPVAGAAIAGAASATTGAGGNARVTFGAPGSGGLRATKAGEIRSATEPVCVTTGTDGACGTTLAGGGAGAGGPAACATTGDDGLCGTRDRRPPRGRILSIREGQRFHHGRGPRILRGIVTPDPSGIADVRLRLTRKDHGRCQAFDGRSERFVAIRRCGATHGRFFSAGDRERWSFLLPARLRRGRYVLDLQARDRAGNRDTLLQRTRTRVVFHVS